MSADLITNLKNIIPDHCSSFIVNSDDSDTKNMIVTSIVHNYKIKYPHLTILSTHNCNAILDKEESDKVKIINTSQIEEVLCMQRMKMESKKDHSHAILIINQVNPNNESLILDDPNYVNISILRDLIINSRLYCLSIVIMDNNFVSNYPQLAPFAYKLIVK